jgi:tRNA uridine 5-carbamoylmethylation protein Kti12
MEMINMATDQNITEIRRIIKDILKKHSINPKENKFRVFYVSFQDLAREGKYFVEFNTLRNIPIEVIEEIKTTGKEEDFILHGGIR